MGKNLKKAPSKETITSFSDIKNFINKNQTKDEKRVNTLLRETVKMPFKRFQRIKKHVINKHEKSVSNNQSNSIIGQTHSSKPKLMTKLIENTYIKRKEEFKNKKLRFSHSKQKSKFRDGVMKVNKNFIKGLSKDTKK